MKYFLSSFLLPLVFLTPLSAQGRVIYTVTDPMSGLDDKWSLNVANAGDVNADGVNDLLVAAPRDSSNSQAGRVDVMSGVDGSSLYSFSGTSPSERYGGTVSGAGDANNDGYDDFLIISYGSSGYADMISGFDGSVLFRISPSWSLSYFGFSAAPCGDWNGDNYDDVVITGIGNSRNYSSMGVTNNGWATVYSGLDGSILSEFEPDIDQGKFGYDVSVGDIDGDGSNDILLSSTQANSSGVSSAGMVRAFSGATGSAMFTLDGATTGDKFGTSIDLLEVNNDGFLDIVVGAVGADYGGTYTGSVYVYDGATQALLNRVDGTGNLELGNVVMNAGDINNDGYDDYMSGSPSATNAPIYTTGAVQIFSGRDHSSLMEFWGIVSRSSFGWSIANLGDTDADGIQDFLIGAPAYNENILSGKIYVISPTVNQAPIANDDFYIIEQDTPTLFDVMANDVDPESDTLYITLDTQPDYGAAVLVGDQIEYSPNPFFVGTDTLIYSVYDPSGYSTQGTVTIVVDQTIRLAVTPLVPGNQSTFEVERCEPFSWFYLCYSLAGSGPTNIGNYQGINFSLELSTPIKSRPPMSLNNQGKTTFRVLVPSTLPSGTVIWMQGVALDITGGTGLTISNALELVVQ